MIQTVTQAVVWALACALVSPISFAEGLKLISDKQGPPPAGLLAQYPAVLTHTHNWRDASGDFEATEKKMVAWCARLGIKAAAVGSAWDPANDSMFNRFEGPDRDLYYSGKFDQKSVMQTEHIRQLLAHLNQLSDGRTYFYLDNETPKTRMGHVWWFGYHYDVPAWHDYSQDRPIKFYRDDPAVEINRLNGQPHVRRNLFEIMAIQRGAGALGIFAHPTRWWIENGKFVTNIASMSALFLAIDGYLDGIAVMGDRPFNKPYQDLWYSFLDTGAKVPGFAETDFFLNKAPDRTAQQTFLNRMHLGDRPLSAERIRDVAKTGDSFASNGAFLTISVDGVPMGSVCQTKAGKTHRVRIEAYPAPGNRFSLIQVIGKHGAVLAAQRDYPGGVLEYELPGSAEPSYVLARAFGPGDDPDGAPKQVKHAAVTNPVYLQSAGFHTERARTSCTLHVPASSRWLGGSIEFQKTDGRPIEHRDVRAGTMRITLPADGRILLHKSGQSDWMFYIAMENPKVEKLVSYLVYGEFRKDYPGLQKGDGVPPAAFHLEEMRDALKTFDYTID